MSGSGSPADHSGKDNTNTDGGTPAGVVPAVDGVVPASGDANLSTDAPSASGEPGAIKDTKPTLADVVKTAAELADDQGKSPAPANDGKDTKVPDADPNAVKTDAEKAEEDKNLPFHNHPRWKEVTGQNRQLSEKVATLEPAAEQFNTIKTFMDTNNLSHDEVGELFVVGAMAKAGDPRALQRIDAFRDKVALAMGEKLPDDIKAQVESGAITEEAGKELSVARAKLKVSDADATRRTEAQAQTDRDTASNNLKRELQGATDLWAVEARKADPDFAKKESAIARYSRALMQERGVPTTREQAVALVKAAYAEVNNDLGNIVPAKQPSKHLPSAPSSNGAKEKPNSLLDAVRQAANL